MLAFSRNSSFNATSLYKMCGSNLNQDIALYSICLNNKRIRGGRSPASDERQQDQEEEEDLWTFHIKSNFWTNGNARMSTLAGPFGELNQSAGGEEMEVRPPDFNRLKCKSVSSSVRRQIDNFVPLVPYRRRTLSWTRWTQSGIPTEGTTRTLYSTFTALTQWVS